MRAFVYWCCFAMVAYPALVQLLAWPFESSPLPRAMWFPAMLFGSFTTVVPFLLTTYLPVLVLKAFSYGMGFLAVRRLWLLVTGDRNVPHSFSGLALWLGYAGFISVMLFVVALTLSILVKAGSGVPAGIVMWPAQFCIPWAFFLTELLSFRKPPGFEDTEPASVNPSVSPAP